MCCRVKLAAVVPQVRERSRWPDALHRHRTTESDTYSSTLLLRPSLQPAVCSRQGVVQASSKSHGNAASTAQAQATAPPARALAQLAADAQACVNSIISSKESSTAKVSEHLNLTSSTQIEAPRNSSTDVAAVLAAFTASQTALRSKFEQLNAERCMSNSRAATAGKQAAAAIRVAKATALAASAYLIAERSEELHCGDTHVQHIAAACKALQAEAAAPAADTCLAADINNAGEVLSSFAEQLEASWASEQTARCRMDDLEQQVDSVKGELRRREQACAQAEVKQVEAHLEATILRRQLAGSQAEAAEAEAGKLALHEQVAVPQGDIDKIKAAYAACEEAEATWHQKESAMSEQLAAQPDEPFTIQAELEQGKEGVEQAMAAGLTIAKAQLAELLQLREELVVVGDQFTERSEKLQLTHAELAQSTAALAMARDELAAAQEQCAEQKKQIEEMHFVLSDVRTDFLESANVCAEQEQRLEEQDQRIAYLAEVQNIYQTMYPGAMDARKAIADLKTNQQQHVQMAAAQRPAGKPLWRV